MSDFEPPEHIEFLPESDVSSPIPATVTAPETTIETTAPSLVGVSSA